VTRGPDISVPVLLVCGDKDLDFPKEVYEETAQDVLDFARQRPRVQPERDAEQPASIDQPAAATDPLATPTPSLAGSSTG